MGRSADTLVHEIRALQLEGVGPDSWFSAFLLVSLSLKRAMFTYSSTPAFFGGRFRPLQKWSDSNPHFTQGKSTPPLPQGWLLGSTRHPQLLQDHGQVVAVVVRQRPLQLHSDEGPPGGKNTIQPAWNLESDGSVKIYMQNSNGSAVV